MNAQHDVRGRVYRTTKGTWCYVVVVHNTVVLADNTGSWKPMLKACIESTAAVRRVYLAGHELESWHKVVRRAAS